MTRDFLMGYGAGRSAGGGGGSSGDGNFFVYSYYIDSSYQATCDKTYAELLAAVDAGKYLVAYLTADAYPGVLLSATKFERTDDAIRTEFFAFFPDGNGNHTTAVYRMTHSADAISSTFY